MSTDLRERLQTSLDGAYTVERELGGGMSRVFVAREIALGRRVVIKVLPPDLVAGVSADRFRREVQIIAQLRHPHVVPLLTAGERDGLLYYTMPYVEGESLRARLTRAGEFPIGEAVRLLRDVADALAYAHRKGVVHRDLKPENILLEEGHALVADFGVAKALASAVDAPDAPDRLTSAGIALGTPAYMSPEQAAADPAMDHRADLYALGVIAYELLTGGHPFAGRPPQALLAAHATETPERVGIRRPAVPPVLGDLVMGLLDKRPSDRPQTADAVLRELDACATAGDRIAPVSAPRAPSTPRQRAWVGLGAAIVLLGLGAGTYWAARTSRDDGAAAPDAPRAGAPDGRTAPSVAAREGIAVLPLAVAPGDTADEYFADGMTDALIDALTKVPGLRVTPRTSTFALKERAGLDLATVGATLGVGTVLEGSVRRAGPRLRVVVALSDIAGNRTLWSELYDRELHTADDVFAVQDSIARAVVGALRDRLGSAAASVGGASLVAHPTADLTAYELYLQGLRLAASTTEAGLLGSLDAYERALARDPGFAAAHAAVASTYAQLADNFVAPRDAYPKMQAAAEQAVALDSASAEAHLALSSVRTWWDWDFAAGARESRRAVELAPHNAHVRQAHAWHVGLLDPARGVVEAERGRVLDPLSPFANHTLTLLLAWAGEHERGLAEARRWVELDPQGPLAVATLVHAYLNLGRYQEAIQAYGGRSCKASLYGCAGVAMAHARLGERDAAARAEAERLLSELTALAREQYVPPDLVAWVYAALGDRDRAFAWLERAYDARSGFLPTLERHPGYAPLRGDPRFSALARKIGLP